MKTNFKKIYSRIVTIAALLLIFSSCYVRKEPEFQYSDFRRVIGPEGGVINFYEYNPKDSNSLVLVSMNFPAGALDSLVVFDMYQYYDLRTYIELTDLNMTETSDFLYFIPFKESFGYNNLNKTDYHLSIEFNDSVEVTYNLKGTTIDSESKLYRIPIPKLNDAVWGENIWVEWDDFGYPVGYNSLDLYYLITGRWTEAADHGTGIPSLANWQEIPNTAVMDSTITFKIANTDYIYVMGSPNVK
jgi:hypothetical protein